jgi:hypothetical protein
LGLAEDVGEHGDEQVNVHHSQYTSMGVAALGEPLKNEGGIILLAPAVEGIIRAGQVGKDVYRKVEKGLEIGGNDSHNRITANTEGNNPDRPVSRNHHLISVGKALLESGPRPSGGLQ